MERIYRVILFGLLVVGFLGAVASADHPVQDASTSKDLLSMIKDIRMAQEVNDINSNNWNQDVANINEDGLSKVEALLSQGETPLETHSHQ